MLCGDVDVDGTFFEEVGCFSWKLMENARMCFCNPLMHCENFTPSSTHLDSGH